jgi:hypothetical protein
MVLHYTDVAEGRIRTRVLGQRRDAVPPIVVVQGMTVSDYLLPACAALGTWTEVHLLDLPGYAGSGKPTRWLDVRGYGETVVHLAGSQRPGTCGRGRPLEWDTGRRMGGRPES